MHAVCLPKQREIYNKWSLPTKNWFNPFTATGRIYTSPKRPSRWPKTYIYVPPQFRFYAFVKAPPPAWLLLHVSEVSSSSVRWSLLALLGLFHWENSSSMLRAVFVQMAGNSIVAVPRCDKLERAVRLMAFVTTAIEERPVSSCWKRGLRMTVDICWERKLVTGAPGGKMTTLLLWTKTSTFQLTVNARLAIAFVKGSSVRMYEHRCEWNIASQLSGEIPSRSAVSEHW